jgi:hypothetical protein
MKAHTVLTFNISIESSLSFYAFFSLAIVRFCLCRALNDEENPL